MDSDTDTLGRAPEQKPWKDLLFSVRVSIRYHMRRQQFFEKWARLAGTAIIVTGTGTFTALFGAKETSAVAMTCAFAVTVLSTLNVYFTPSEWARKHAELRKRFTELENEMTGIDKPSLDACRKITQKRLSIEAEEPPVMRLLVDICHNEQCFAQGAEESDFAPIGQWQRKVAHVWSFDIDMTKPTSPPPK